MKSAIVTGATGQDGAYLCQALLEKGYRVCATHRRASSFDPWRLRHLGLLGHARLHLQEFDVGDACAAIRLIESHEPTEIYNLAAQTFVGTSFEQPITTSTINCLGALNLLEAIRTVDRKIRYYQASSAEMFGKVQSVPQSETTPFYPRSPYGVSKLFSHWMTINYRESYSLFACSGILFNHESPLRGPEFVTRRISQAVARISAGDTRPLRLGNLNARRDWGYAKDYVDGMWRMLQASTPDSYVLATGRTETVRDFATTAFAAAGIRLRWEGAGESERGYADRSGTVMVEIDPALYRPAEVEALVGDSSKARRLLGWQPTTDLEELCTMMVEADLARASAPPPGWHGALAQPVARGLSPVAG